MEAIYTDSVTGQTLAELVQSAAGGETKEIELILREPQERYLLFVDDNQEPVSDVKVKTYMFWSNSNHCGAPSGANFLTEGHSDEQGRVMIPDGEFEYLLEIEQASDQLETDSRFNPMSPTMYLSSPETVIKLHYL